MRAGKAVENANGYDLIQELRLRRWARENYLPGDLRPDSLHAIVLDEMCCRDRELEISAVNRQYATAQYVPLAPEGIYIVHPADTQMRGPHFTVAADVEEREYAAVRAEYHG